MLAGFLGWLVWAGGEVQLQEEARHDNPPLSIDVGSVSTASVSNSQLQEADSGSRKQAKPDEQAPTEDQSSETEEGALLSSKRKRIIRCQVALAREGISPGPIDGYWGAHTKCAVEAFQFRERLGVTAELDRVTQKRLQVSDPVWRKYTVTRTDLGGLTSVSSTWVGKSKQEYLGYESILELVAEKGRATTGLVKTVNPDIEWDAVEPGASIRIPNVEDPSVEAKAGFLRIKLGKKTLQARSESGRLLAHFPCSIGRRAQDRPVGKLQVEVVVENPNYRFDPEVFPESPEARKLDRVLMIPPGPNNPVGTAWIGLDRPGYGIHGTPRPENVGRTESHGCFRLANWNAEFLLRLVEPDIPVYVEP